MVRLCMSHVITFASDSQVTSDDVTEEDDLKTSQEEADTRVIFHAKHAAPNVSSIIMVAEDTDIILLCLAFHKDIHSSVYVKCGTATRTRYQHLQSVSCPGLLCVCFSSWITFIYRM